MFLLRLFYSWLYDEKSNGYQYYQLLLQNGSSSIQSMNQSNNDNHNNNNNNMSDQSQTTTTTTTRRRKRRRFSAHDPLSKDESNKDESSKDEVEEEMTRNRFCENHIDGDDNDIDIEGVLATKDKSLDKMNAYITKLEDAAKEKRDTRYDRANQMSIFNGGSSHHIGHYLPENELNKFNHLINKSRTNYHHDDNDKKLTHKNRGHALLKRMGWNEGQGLGRNKQGNRIPVSSIIHKKETNSGIGSNDTKGKKPWDPTPGDDAFDLYKKKMMLSYRHRPNPLVCNILYIYIYIYTFCYSLSICNLFTGKPEKRLLLNQLTF